MTHVGFLGQIPAFLILLPEVARVGPPKHLGSQN